DNFVGYGVKSVFNGGDNWNGFPSTQEEGPDKPNELNLDESDCENGPFEACGRAIVNEGLYDLAKETFVSYIPDENYFSVNDPVDESRTINLTTFGGVPLIKVTYSANNNGSTV